MKSDRPDICFIVSPNSQKGGGMGRVKDYIIEAASRRSQVFRFVALDTRGSGRAVWSILHLLYVVLRIWLEQARHRLALVHVNMGDRGSAVRKAIVVLLARAAGGNVVLHLHAVELIQHYRASNALVRWLIRQPFHKASCCIAMGKLWMDWLVDELGVPGDRVEIIYNGVPIAPPKEPASERFKSDRPQHILFLGNLLERKGVSDLLHALAELPNGKTAWRATLAGGGNLAYYQALAEELGLAGNLRFEGWVDQRQARKLLLSADLLVLPSYDEGLPLVILEALGSGTPVIATPIGAIPEVLTDRETILFVSPGNRQQLVDTLSELIGDLDLRIALSERGLYRFRQRFSLDAFAGDLFALYKARFGIELDAVMESKQAAWEGLND